MFGTPEADDLELSVIHEVEQLQRDLNWRLAEPRRWFGSLRRISMARAIQGSNTIEGYDAPLDDAAAIDLGEEPLDADEETHLALKGYRDAMTFVLQLATETHVTFDVNLIKSLHFMMTSYQLANRPGLWRLGTIMVRNESTGEIVYEGPDVADVDPLMDELMRDLNDPEEDPPLVAAGMAHLNLVMIHPFRDGNGRMARCLQTLVLARRGVLYPTFCSIEEYLGRNTQAYYDVLARVGGGHWDPARDARPWIRFVLTAHLRQARTVAQRLNDSERLWSELEHLVHQERLPERVVTPLFDAALGFRIRNATYRAVEDSISEQTASKDLRLLVDRGLLEPHGEKRGRYYTATPHVQAIRREVVAARGRRNDDDPFDRAR